MDTFWTGLIQQTKCNYLLVPGNPTNGLSSFSKNTLHIYEQVKTDIFCNGQ